jgi:hypothetical protein
MKHSKRRKTSQYAAGFVRHVLSQRIGLIEVSRTYQHRRTEPRQRTATALLSARREIRELIDRIERERAA